jgi:hypothetical protein
MVLIAKEIVVAKKHTSLLLELIIFPKIVLAKDAPGVNVIQLFTAVSYDFS